MGHSKIILIVLRLLPFNSRTSVRVRSHVERCEKCRQSLASREKALAVMPARSRLPETEDFWPRLVFDLKKEPAADEARRPARRWRWALGTAGVLAAVLASFLILTPRREAPAGPLVKLRIDSVSIYGQPAQAFIFQTQDADSTFVWVEKQNSN
jgi:hypothetical protein